MTHLDQQTGAPVADAEYGLYRDGNLIGIEHSDEYGRIHFSGLFPGLYKLLELKAPTGYETSPVWHLVSVGESGCVSIEGQPADTYILRSSPAARGTVFSFYCCEENSGIPLPGVCFHLSNNNTSVSDSRGIVDFGQLSPGAYTMTEFAVPDGYETRATTYLVEADTYGDISVDDVTLSEFTVRITRREDTGPLPGGKF